MKAPRDPFEVIEQYLRTKTEFIVVRIAGDTAVRWGNLKVLGMSEEWIYIHDTDEDVYESALHAIRRSSIAEIQLQVLK